jgi:hypothetical protein
MDEYAKDAQQNDRTVLILITEIVRMEMVVGYEMH